MIKIILLCTNIIYINYLRMKQVTHISEKLYKMRRFCQLMFNYLHNLHSNYQKLY